MKIRLAIVSMALAGLMTFGQSIAKAQVSFSASVQIGSSADFYEPLSLYGTWVNFGTYGRCWRPARVEAGWRPYSNGEWVWTDAGWYWQSDEPWSWACYHYGSWYCDANYGWIWIPGTEWAPAWVTWRYSDSYIGWAPCGPRLSVLAPSFFVFADVHHFQGHHQGGDLIVNNTTIINRTKIVNKFPHARRNVDGVERNIVINTGPGVQPIERATGTRFTARPVTEVSRQTPLPDNIRRNDVQRSRDRNQPLREITPPTGRDQPRTYQQQQQQPLVVPKEPDHRSWEQQNLNPPTGRDQQRIFHEVPAPVPQHRTGPPQVTPPAAPPPRGVQPPPGPEPRPEMVPPGQERNRERDHDHDRDGNFQ